MKAVLLLAVKSALARKLSLGITLLAITLASALLLAVERLRSDARQSFAQAITGVDLVVGSRSSGVQLVLHAVFHLGEPTGSVDWSSYRALADHPAVDWVVPLSLGDSHRGFAVLGTTVDYFARVRHGDAQPIAMASGRPFATVFEAVLGGEVARELGYRVGDRIVLSHGLAPLGHDHDDKPFTVVGVLGMTGTPIDRTVHVSLEAISAIHLDWAGGAPLPGFSIPAEYVGKFDLQPKEVSALLVGLRNRADVFRVQRQISAWTGEPLSAVMPGVALDELWRTLAMIERLLFAMSALVVVTGLSGLAATLLAGLGQRRRELAILRALGAGTREIFLMLVVEGLAVTLLGSIAGVGLLMAATSALAPVARESLGVVLSLRAPDLAEWLLLGSIVATGLLLSLVPGWRAWRMSLADGLIPRA